MYYRVEGVELSELPPSLKNFPALIGRKAAAEVVPFFVEFEVTVPHLRPA